MTTGIALDRTVRLLRGDFFSDKVSSEDVLSGLTTTRVRICADERNLMSANGQTVVTTLTVLLSTMGVKVDLDIPSVGVICPQPPLVGPELKLGLLDLGNDLIPEVSVTQELGDPDVILAIGDTVVGGGRVIRVCGDAAGCLVGTNIEGIRWVGGWPVGALAAAASTATEVLRVATERISLVSSKLPSQEYNYRLSPAISLSFANAGALERAPIDLGYLDFISAGAITNASIYCLLRFPELAASLRLMDEDRLELPNLNRYALMRRSHCGSHKVDVLASYANSKLEIEGIRQHFDESWGDFLGHLSPRVLVGADRIPVRWQVQAANPDWLSVGGTSHFFSLVSTHQPGG
ncbi:MAG: ThiF family adenylyltransferase, partial [Candidatus Dormiibacterota bacterium]